MNNELNTSHLQSHISLLRHIDTISESYKRVERATGEGFDIFSVLKIENNEVTTHSRFLAEILNPKGAHGHEDEFLKLFIDKLKIETKLDTANALVRVEYYTGRIRGDKGGNIDIFIYDNQKNCIMIENKIYAGEQPNQLLRYHNYNRNGTLLYPNQNTNSEMSNDITN